MTSNGESAAAVLANGKVGKVFCHVTNRSVMQRLDDVCGPGNWKVEFREYDGGKDHHGRCVASRSALVKNG